MYDQLITPATTEQADAILASWGAANVRPLESRNAVWPEPLVQIIGDTKPASRAELVERARRMVRRPDLRHAVRLLDMRGLRTADVPEDRLDELVEHLIVDAELPWSAGPEAIAQAELDRPLAVLPFRIAVGDRYFTTRRSHAFGDLYGGSYTFPSLVLADVDEPAPLPHRAPLARALAYTLGRRPGSVVAALRADRWEPPAHTAAGEPQLWRRALHYVTSAPGWLDELTAGLDPERVTLAGWLTAQLHRATREAGIAAHPGALVVTNCRRYLPRSARHLSGNFVGGSFLRMADPSDPVVATAAIREYTTSARPLLAMAASRLSDTRRSRGGDRPQLDRLPDPKGRAYLGLSHCPRLPWPSRSTPVPGCAYNVPTPIGSEGIAAVTMRVGDRLSVSLAYAQGRYDPAAIQHIGEALTGNHTRVR